MTVAAAAAIGSVAVSIGAIVAAAIAIAAVAAIAIAVVGVAAANGCHRAGISPAGGAGLGSVAIVSLTIVDTGRVVPDRIAAGVGYAARGATRGRRSAMSEAVGDAMEVHPDFADRRGDAGDAGPGGMCAGIPRRLA